MSKCEYCGKTKRGAFCAACPLGRLGKMTAEVWARERFARRIREERAQRVMDQNEFAKLLGVSNALVSYWETAKRMPSKKLIKQVAVKLGKTVMDLLKE